MKDNNRDFGVLYFVDNNPLFRQMMAASIQSLRRFHPDWPIKVIECPPFRISLWKKAYRTLSFWRNKKRLDRGNWDVRVIAAKADAMLNSPFRHTLYLDSDTIIMRSLDTLREKAMQADVLVTPLPWKRYKRSEGWQPKTFPYLMAGLNFYNHRFVTVYREYVSRFDRATVKLPTMDQFIFSLACEMESSRLNIIHEPTMQIDVINAAEHLGTHWYPRRGECMDLEWDGLSRFHIFHYNEFKHQYMRQIKEVWGWPVDTRA